MRSISPTVPLRSNSARRLLRPLSPIEAARVGSLSSSAMAAARPPGSRGSTSRPCSPGLMKSGMPPPGWRQPASQPPCIPGPRAAIPRSRSSRRRDRTPAARRGCPRAGRSASPSLQARAVRSAARVRPPRVPSRRSAPSGLETGEPGVQPRRSVPRAPLEGGERDRPRPPVPRDKSQAPRGRRRRVGRSRRRDPVRYEEHLLGTYPLDPDHPSPVPA